MDLQLVKVFLPIEEAENVRQLLSSYPELKSESVLKTPQQLVVKILVEKEQAETVIDRLNQKLAHLKDFQLVLLPVETILAEAYAVSPEPKAENEDLHKHREVYDRVSKSVRLSSTEIAMVIISTIIAAIGLLEGNQVVIIGAMVIAPLLKPNMALGVATTFGDLSLAIRTVKVGLTEICISLLLSILLGVLVPVNLEMPEIAMRTTVNLPDVALAFASGVAGAISLTVGEQSAVVGVMVSVALLPPLVVLGMLIGSQLWSPAIGTVVLVSLNIVCLNLAAIATFWLRDIRPQSWWQKFQASKITGIATVFWLILLALLVAVIFMYQFGKAHTGAV